MKRVIEIETGKSSSIYIIKKDLETRFNEIFSIFMKKDIKDKILLHFQSLRMKDNLLMGIGGGVP